MPRHRSWVKLLAAPSGSCSDISAQSRNTAKKVRWRLRKALRSKETRKTFPLDPQIVLKALISKARQGSKLKKNRSRFSSKKKPRKSEIKIFHQVTIFFNPNISIFLFPIKCIFPESFVEKVSGPS